jgi:hypothetical protein
MITGLILLRSSEIMKVQRKLSAPRFFGAYFKYFFAASAVNRNPALALSKPL